MARYTGPRTKVSRRARQLLDENKAKYFDRRPYPPGEHGRGRIRESLYQIQLREKQKLRFIYGVLEKQFRRYYKEASRQGGIAGENLMVILETRLDNVVYRSGLAATRPQARQLVNHGHFQVNGKKVDICSFQVSAGDVVTTKERSRNALPIQHSVDTIDRVAPEWMTVDKMDRKIAIDAMPTREQIDTDIKEQLIVELYSK
ncbi:MAG: 30S ribosomal protein S4 [Actinobacteria bacterium]|uniref:SSU ribosomal protein S4p (S9e) @ SSU ribosomal protein S4p (S9e), zinc-independent n=1 Tax=hydrothermal vent metagenome TaxID=652676 RepID=A0A3B0SXH8_9ZZZZ|nr:30S ribosomal protein S4 [Actinomycetota bacterium]